ncbi:RloB domain-containing protein [bacterium]|nr:RloB domain-containing protein [bacterium]
MRLTRPIKPRNPKFNFYIVSEGKTEERYYSGIKNEFQKNKFSNFVQIIPTVSKHSGADKVVQYAKMKYGSVSREFCSIFCVFDKDQNTDEQIRDALELASKNGFKIVFSNPCFEVWFLAHFRDEIKHISRDKLQSILEKDEYLGLNYKAQKANNYSKLKNKTQKAIVVSKKIHKPDKKYFDEGNPSTDIHELMIAIEEKLKEKGQNFSFK